MKQGLRVGAGWALGGVFVIGAGVVVAGPVDQDCGWTALNGYLQKDPVDLVVFDSGAGPQVLAASALNLMKDGLLDSVQVFNGSSWEPLGPAPGVQQGALDVLEVFDDGSGPVLFGKGFLNLTDGRDATVARWNGAAWVPFDPDVINIGARDMIVFDEGSGPALYLGGARATVGGVLTESRVVRFDGSVWSAVDSGLDGTINALEVYDDGGGGALYALGTFSIGGVPAQVARLDGASWTPLGGVISGTTLNSLAVFDDGTGPALYAGGHMQWQAPVVVRWDGVEWVSIASGLEGQWIAAMTSHDDGSGPALYAGGLLERAGGVASGSLARWNGASWSPVGDSTHIDPLVCMFSFVDENKSALYVGGTMNPSPTNPGHSVSRWNNPLLICPVDFDLNCAVNFFDIRTFLNLFLTQDPAADFNSDGVFDFADVAAFVDAFAAGCP
ncbi:MAG: hypothetical protein LAT64_05005 [Phycisphaerales bacterium]|nr:hypothetical protein [Planctomycetota bacterium]MCH8508114.1 hypothetical protein [Phycisphaerales bacterium]